MVIPTTAQVVIVGGGIVGCSVAYHLTKRGIRDVVLLERKKLTCGTTWHAAGLVGQLRATHNLTRLAQYTTRLYETLESETGQATGYRQIGSLAIASDHSRFEELRRGASMARCFGLEVAVIAPSEAKALWPLMDISDIVGAVFLPKDGQTNPVDTTMALAKGAKLGGAKIIEDVSVERILLKDDVAIGVLTSQGPIRADYVVNCGGMWARAIAETCGASVPLHAAEHFYVVTEPMGLPNSLPVLRDGNSCTYFKEDAGKLLVGWFESQAKPWGMEGIRDDFAFDELPQDFAHVEPLLEKALHRVPRLAETGLQVFFNGPESFTPDDRYLIGETPEVRNLFVAAGFNSIGIQSAGGAGKVVADWIADGHPPMDLWDVDIRRMMPFQSNKLYLKDRTVETLGLLYAMHWPYRQPETARGVRKSVLHDRLSGRGACFGEVAGWERPNWFAPAGMKAEYEYSYGRQNWFSISALEHRAVREAVGIFDQSSFAKFVVEGRDAEAALNYICANDVAVLPGRIVYTQWLNERGGIEADVTVTRESQDRYLVVTSAATAVRDLAWLRRNIPKEMNVAVVDVTSAYAVIGVMGPNSRTLLGRLTGGDLSHDAFAFAHSKIIDLCYAKVRASRITYVGELGWELYIPTEFAQSCYDALIHEGKDLDARDAGYHAMNSLRMEKAYRHWGHDITDEDSPYEAGLGFAVATQKATPFIGRAAALRSKQSEPTRRLTMFALRDLEKLLYHNEPIWRNGKIVGRITSGMFGHTLGRPLGMGYVENTDGPATPDFISEGDYEVEIAGERVEAEISLRPFYDPQNKRVKM